MPVRKPRPPQRPWKRFLGGLTAALLLLPVPAYATLTWVPWTESESPTLPTGENWKVALATPSGSSDYLWILAESHTGQGNPYTGVITFSTTVTQLAGTTDSITPNISGLNNLTMTAGNVTWQMSINGVNQYASGNQFFSPNSGPTGTQTGSGITLTNTGTSSTSYNVNVTFTFSSANWTSTPIGTPSSSFALYFNGT